MPGRRPREDRSELLSRVVAVRLTEKEGTALDALVDHHNAKLRRLGLTPAITSASFCRSCVVQVAVRAGLLPPLGGELPDDDDADLVVVAPQKRTDRNGPPLPPPTRFDRALAFDTLGEEPRTDAGNRGAKRSGGEPLSPPRKAPKKKPKRASRSR